MVFASWLKKFSQSLERQARVQRELLADSLRDGLRERPARGRRLAHRHTMGQSVEVVEARALLSTVMFTVNTTVDTVDANVGDGLAEDSMGNTSLRAAIMEANASTADRVEIQLAAQTYDLTRTVSGADGDDEGDLNITNTNPETTILISGVSEATTTIDATAMGGGINARIFNIASIVHQVEIEDVTLRGTATGDGGAILNNSFLELDKVTITGSSTTGKGGGLFNSMTGSATVIDSTFSSNTSTDRGAGLFNNGVLTLANAMVTSNTAQADGGGLATGLTAFTNVVGSTLTGNMAQNSGRGGAVAVDGGFFALDVSRLTGNTGTDGGGIVVTNSGGVSITHSTLDANTANGGVGGAVSIVSGDVTVQNSTLSGNTATTDGSAGGAIRMAAGSLFLTNATITLNDASAGSDGGVSVAGGVATVVNTIIGGNTASGSNPDVAGTFTSLGTNVVQDTTGSTGFSGGIGDIFMGPRLNALADNGGGTPTHSLQTGAMPSPALDAANVSFAPSDDQRRVPRISPDIGAYEVDPLAYFVNTFNDTLDANPLDMMPTDSMGNVSLRSAIMALNSGEGGNGTIILPPGQFTLTQTSGAGSDTQATNDLDLMAFSGISLVGAGSLSTTIDGSGLTGDGISTTGDDRVLHITGGSVSITGLSIENGNAGTFDGGGILLEFGDLALKNTNVEGNQAANGGGVATGFSSVDSLTVENATFFENTATSAGGGLALLSFFNQTPTISHSNISRNTAGTTGGGVVTGSALEITGTSLIRNTAGTDGGGIAADSGMFGGGSLEIRDSFISENTASGFGGGIAGAGLTEVTSTLISMNSASLSGGGIAATSGNLNINSSDITGNIATQSGGGVAIGTPPMGAGMMDPMESPMEGPTLSGQTFADIEFTNISGNTAGTHGGGVANSGGRLFLFTSAVTGNTATADGGGLANTAQGISEVVSSTFSGNMTTTGRGGGLVNDSGTLDVTNATLTLNTAVSGGGIASLMNAATTVQNTISAGNTGSVSGTDVFADTLISSGGNNVIGVGEFGFVNGTNNDQTGTPGTPLDTRLGPLQNNGGVTQTHALLTGGPASPAIDAGDNTSLDATDAESDVDQRGAERILGASVDAGAFESGSSAIFVTTAIDVVDGGDGLTSLREAITAANVAANADRIVLPAGTFRLDILGSGEDANMTGDLDITNPVTIVGAGMGVTIIDGGMNDRVFDVNPFGGSLTATFLDLTIQNGQAGTGGGIQAMSSTTTLDRVEVANNVGTMGGGGIDNFAGISSLIVRNSYLHDNVGFSGGAIANTQDSLTVENSRFERNMATGDNGGAILIVDSPATITGSEFLSNSATAGGGAIRISDTGDTAEASTITASRFAGNTAGSGGAISISDATDMGIQTLVTIQDSEFADFMDEMQSLPGNQTTTGDGGAILNLSADLNILGTRFRNNTSNSFGGAIVNAGTGAMLTVQDSVFENNMANPVSGGGGAIYTDQTAAIDRSTFSGNMAPNGGALDNGGILTITNSTLSSNMASNQGGGLANRFSGSATVEFSTITQNTSGMGGGGILQGATSVTLRNTIVAFNTDSNGQNADVQGTFTSNGNNLIGDVDAAMGFPGTNDLIGGNALTATVSGATNASPIQITATSHGLTTGDLVRIEGVVGNDAANGTFFIIRSDDNNFTLFDTDSGFAVSGSGTYSSGGQVFKLQRARLGMLQNNTTPDDPMMGEMEPQMGAGAPDEIQAIDAVIPFSHRPQPVSAAIDAGVVVGGITTDTRGAGFPRDVDGDNAGGSMPDIGALELLLTTVTGTVFDDVDGDGIQDAGELGQQDVTVYADINQNGILDNGDRFITTDTNGDYTLDLVPPGSQIIREVLPVPFVPGDPTFRQTTPRTPRLSNEQTLVGATSQNNTLAADFDRDGDLDLAGVVPGTDGVRIYRNQGSGQPFVTAVIGIGVSPSDTAFALASGDFNNDGFTDLAVLVDPLAGNSLVRVLLNNQAGGFVSLGTVAVSGEEAFALEAADFNGDGNLDVAVANYDVNSVTILSGDGLGGLTDSGSIGVGTNPAPIVALDVDADGDIDLVTGDTGANQLTVLTNDGNGGFSSAETIDLGTGVPTILTAGDIDGDGLDDLVVGFRDGSEGKLRVLFNRGDGARVEIDLGVVAAGGRNLGSAVITDFDGDGFQDVVSLSYYFSLQNPSQVRVFGGTGNATLQPAVILDVGNNRYDLVAADISGDGLDDFVMSDYLNDGLFLYTNLTGSADVTAVTGVIASGLDFGNQQLASISGTKFNDLDGDGIFRQDTLNFFDDFNQGIPDFNWQNERGAWSIVGGEYVATVPGNVPPTYNSLPFSLTDFEIELDIKNEGDGGGVWLRSTAMDPTFPGGVLLVVGGSTVNGGTGLYWHIFSDGAAGPVLNDVGGLFTPGDDLNIRVVVEGDNYVAYLNGSTIPATTLNTSMFANGSLALYSNSMQTFDNVRVSNVANPEPGLANVAIFLDTNGNGRQDAFEPTTMTRMDDPFTTGIDETGQYVFNDVVPGDVTVYEVVPPGFQQTTQQMNVELTEFNLASVGNNAVDSLIADFDGDGRNDVVVLSQEASFGNIRVFAGTGTQYVNLATTLTAGISPEAFSAADLDGDGDLDLAVANAGDDSIQLFENTGDLNFISRTMLTVTSGDLPSDLVLADVNGDGQADVIVSNFSSPTGSRGVSIFTNNNSMPGAGNYAFNAAVNLDTGGQTVAVEAADLDNDGDLDIAAVVIDTDRVQLFENDNGVFLAPEQILTGIGPRAIAISDFNRDGRADVVIGKNSPGFGIEVYEGVGLFEFGSALGFATTRMPDSFAVADLDQNGFEDIVFTDPSRGDVGLLLSDEVSFLEGPTFNVATQITGVSVGDLDFDGVPDVVVVQESSGADAVALFTRLGSIPINLSAGQQVAGMDFGNVQLGTIGGTKFHDLDLDGIQDPEEEGIAGLKIFLDINRDGRFDPDVEPFAVTDEDGTYQLNDVPVLMPISVAEEVIGTGFFQTFPNQFLVSADGMEFDSSASPQETAVGDIDGDGDLDVAVASFAEAEVGVGLVDPVKGTVQRISVPVDMNPIAVRLADINGDGDLDVISLSTSQASVSVALGGGDGTFAASVSTSAGTSPQSLTIGDFDGMNGLDVAITNQTANTVTLLFNNGSGVLGSLSSVSVGTDPREIVTGDFNGDMDLDLAVANRVSGDVSILSNNGSGMFTETQVVSVGPNPFGLAVGDFSEANAALDLVVVNDGDDTFQLLTNNGSAVFVAGTAVPTGLMIPRRIAAGDLDGDGHLDIAIADNAMTATDLLIGLGDGNGGFATQLIASDTQRDVVFGDISGNGRPDVIVTLGTRDAIEVLPNRTGSHEITLTPGETRSSVDFGNRSLPGSISGIKFRDDNGDGIQNGGEPGLPGFTVYLDLDNDDVLDGGEPSFVTLGDGSYEFTGLESLQPYTVSEVQQAGFLQTTPLLPGFTLTGDLTVGGGFPAGIATGDFDGLNGEDIAVTLESSNQVAVLLRQPNGEFGAPTLLGIGMEPFSIVAADFNGGGLDLAVANEADGMVQVLLNNGSGVFTPQTAIAAGDTPLDMVVADIDGANGPDVIVVNRGDDTFRILLNNGSGVLVPQTPVSTGPMPSSVAVADYDLDGRLDVAVTTSGNDRLTVFLQTSPGTFVGQAPIVTGTDPSRVRTADLNNDGKFDLVVVNQQSSSVTVVLNNNLSPGTLNLAAPATFSTGVSGESLVLADFNSDGFADIASSGEDDENLSLILNNGAGAFGSPVLFPLDGTFPVEIAPINLNADGDADLVITDGNFNEIVLLTSTTGSHSVFLGAGQDLAGQNFGNRDVVDPTAASFLRQTPTDAATSADQVTFRVTFSEDVQNVGVADFVLAGTAAGDGTISNAVAVTASSVFDITVTGLTSSNGTIDLDFSGSQDIADLGGNLLVDTTPAVEEIYTLDNTAPTVTSINRADANPTSATSVDFTVMFNEAVSGIGTADFVLATTGSATGMINSVSASSGMVVTVSVNAVMGNGTLGLNFDADASGGVTDVVGLVSMVDFTGQTYTIDNTSPTVTVNIVDASLTDADDSSNVTFAFSEPTSDFDLSDVMATNGTLSSLMGSGASYSATFTADNGVVATGTVTVNAGSYTDATGNTGASGSDNVAIDTNDGPVINNLGGDTLTFTEGDPSQIVDQGTLGVVTDADSANFAGGSLHVLFPSGKLPGDDLSIRDQGTGMGQIGFDGMSVTFEGVEIGTFMAGSVMVAFNANATPPAVSALINNVTYENDSDTPSAVNRMVRFDVDDGAGGAFSTSSVTVTVEVTAVNDAPFFAGAFPPSLNFTEGGAPLLLGPAAELVDFELDAIDNWEGASLFIERAGSPSLDDVFDIDPASMVTVSGSDLVIDGLSRGTFSLVGGEGIIDFNMNTRASDVDQILQAITYRNVSEDPPVSLTLDAEIDDGNTGSQGTGGALNGVAAIPITITPLNDAPVLNGIEVGDITYLEGDAPVVVSSMINVTDVDDTDIQSAKVVISSNYQMGFDVLTANTSGTGISAFFDSNAGELILTGGDSLSTYQSVLRSVTFQNTSSNPTETVRTVGFTVNDGDADSIVASRNVDVQLRPVSVTGIVWLDTLEDGIFDIELETVVPDVMVSLVDSNGMILASTTTQPDGSYSFTGIRPGTVRVAFSPPDARHFTIQNALVGGMSSDLDDSDPSRLTGQTQPITLGSGEMADNVDAGLVVTTVSIAPPAFLPEGTGGQTTAAEFALSLNGPATRVVTVNVLASDITATLGTDYEQFPAGQLTVTFQPGEVTKIASLNVTRDDIPEADETFQVALSSPAQAVLGVQNTAVATIVNDDMVTVPRVIIESDPVPFVNESDPLDLPNLVYIARLATGPADEDITVSFETDETPMLSAPLVAATPTIDYTPASGTVTIFAGQTTAKIRVQVVGDLDDEPDETVVVTLTGVSGAGAQLGAPNTRTANGTIVDNDDPTPTLRILDTEVRELNAPSEPGMAFVVERLGSTSLAITGTYQTVLLSGDGTAQATDFVAPDPEGTFAIAAGQSETVIIVPVIGDSLSEGDETFGIELLTAMQVQTNGMSGGSVGFERSQAIGTILGDDDAPVVSLRQGASQLEGRAGRGGVLMVTAEASAVAATDIVLTVSTIAQNGAGIALASGPRVVNADYIPLTDFRFVIPAGATSASFPIQILGDDLVEADERIRVSLTSVSNNATLSNSQSEVDSTIVTDDRNTAVLKLTGGQIAIERDGVRTSNIGFTAEIDSVLTRNLIVNYETLPLPAGTVPMKLATPDVDFIATQGQIRILAGQLSAPFAIVGLPDNISETPLEDVFVKITSFSLGPVIVPGRPAPLVVLDELGARARSSIQDDDGVAAILSIDAATSFREGNVGNMPVLATVTLSGPADQDLLVNYRTRTSTDANAATAGMLNATGQPIIASGTPSGLNPDFERRVEESVLIPRGQLTATLPVRVIGDRRFEGDEQFFIELTRVTLADGTIDPTVGRINPAARQSVVTILDDEFEELPSLSFRGSVSNEGDPGDDVDAVFELSLSGRIPQQVTIEVQTRNAAGVGLAEAVADQGDFFMTRRVITLDAENTSAQFLVGLIEDDDNETDELIFAEIVSVVGAVLAPGQQTAVSVIRNDDDPAAAVFSVDDVSVLEGDDNSGNLVFTVSLNIDPAKLGGAVTVNVATFDDTATAGDDYTAVNQVLTFDPGVLTQTVSVPIIGDANDEPTEDVVLQLSAPSAGAIDGSGQGIGSILNDDSADVTLRVDSVTLREGDADGATFADFTVSRVGQSSRDVLVDFATEADTAEVDVDFRAASGTLTFTSSGADEQIVSVPIISDTIQEEELELFVLRLSNARFDTGSNMSGSVAIDPAFEQGEGGILDDDQRVFLEDGDAQLLLIAQEIRDAQEEFGADPENPLLLAFVELRARLVLTRLGLASGLVFVTDPVDFLLDDTEGRTTGYTAEDGEMTEVARSYYSGDGNVELVVLPDATPGLFPLQLSEVGSGEYIQVATLVTENGDSKTITNNGTLTEGVELVLDFTDVGQNNFPRTGEEIFAQLADGDGASNTTNTDGDALAVSGAALDALAELQRQQRLEDNRPVVPAAFFLELAKRVDALGGELMGTVWKGLDDLFEVGSEEERAILSDFWTSFGRTLLGSPSSAIELIDLLKLLGDAEDSMSDGDAETETEEEANSPEDQAQPQDDAEANDAQAARRERSRTRWLADLIATAEESPWQEVRPGDRNARQSQQQALANTPRSVNSAAAQKQTSQSAAGNERASRSTTSNNPSAVQSSDGS